MTIADARMEMRRRDQQLSPQERELLSRGYALFEFFREQLEEEHRQMRQARSIRGAKENG